MRGAEARLWERLLDAYAARVRAGEAKSLVRAALAGDMLEAVERFSGRFSRAMVDNDPPPRNASPRKKAGNEPCASTARTRT